MIYSVWSDLGPINLTCDEDEAHGLVHALAVYGVKAWVVLSRG